VTIHVATGIVRNRAGSVLLVASTYANHPHPLWNLPGGRQTAGELLDATAARELFEETGIRAEAGRLAYVSESYDGETHVVNVTFEMNLLDEGNVEPAPPETRDDHVAAVAWVPVAGLPERLTVDVVREPLLAYLGGDFPRRYVGFERAGITIVWPDET